MNKTAIKNYAVWARVQLIEAVKQKAYEYEINDGDNKPIDVIGDRPLTKQEKEQRRQLIAEINEKGYENVMEEVAYTWFNRFIALRFMEVNGYLPTKIRVFTDEDGAFKPQILKEAVSVELGGIDREKVIELFYRQDNETLYRYLIILQCNALSESLPLMFEKLDNPTELLFPGNLLKPDSVLGRMVSDIPEEDWTDQVQIIGWLYQYYNSELKDDTFAQLKKNVKISKERIPAATQLFTPDWIVRYMVENSLGRIYINDRTSQHIGEWSEQERIAREKDIADEMGWRYYLPEAEQAPEVRASLNAERTVTLDELPSLKLIDPCMGSGHILVYAFDVLMDIYLHSGYNERDAVRSILQNNLYGLDIDDRAAQLAYFAVMMKARQYDRRVFTRCVQPHVYAIAESNGIDNTVADYFTNNDPKLKIALDTLRRELFNAKEYGSILNISQVDLHALYTRADEVCDEIGVFCEDVQNDILPLIHTAEAMSQKYDVVVTNPPYMGSSGMSANLSEFIKKNYPDSKSDLFAIFIERCGQMTKENGYQAMITQHSWMFLSSFEKLRLKLLDTDIVNMVHLGARAFEEIGGEVVQTASFVFRKSNVSKYKGEYCRLIEPTTQQAKEDMFLAGENRYASDQSNFSKIPGSPVAYWVSDNILSAFEVGIQLGNIANPRQGMATGENERFVRFWHETNIINTFFTAQTKEEAQNSQKKWFPYNKGGDFRKWYGNNDFVVNWYNDGYEIRHFTDNQGKLRSRPQNTDTYFNESITWSKISSGTIAFRYKPFGHIYDVAGTSIFADHNKQPYLLAFCNSNVAMEIAKILSPTINYEVGHIASFPIIFSDKYNDLVNEVSINLTECSHNDWDSYETSWDFKRHPLV